MVNIPQSLGYTGWKDLTIGDYDYAYLCTVRFRLLDIRAIIATPHASTA